MSLDCELKHDPDYYRPHFHIIVMVPNSSTSKIKWKAEDISVSGMMKRVKRKTGSLPVRTVELEVRQVSEGGRRDAVLLQISLRGVEVQDRSVAGCVCPSDMINAR